jgi:hypothetical protein
VSLAASIWFRQVVLDGAADLQRRHAELLQLTRTAGFSSCSTLAACLAPCNRVSGCVACSFAKRLRAC